MENNNKVQPGFLDVVFKKNSIFGRTIDGHKTDIILGHDTTVRLLEGFQVAINSIIYNVTIQHRNTKTYSPEYDISIADITLPKDTLIYIGANRIPMKVDGMKVKLGLNQVCFLKMDTLIIKYGTLDTFKLNFDTEAAIWFDSSPQNNNLYFGFKKSIVDKNNYVPITIVKNQKMLYRPNEKLCDNRNFPIRTLNDAIVHVPEGFRIFHNDEEYYVYSSQHSNLNKKNILDNIILSHNTKVRMGHDNIETSLIDDFNVQRDSELKVMIHEKTYLCDKNNDMIYISDNIYALIK